jgi:hypothetical protein
VKPKLGTHNEKMAPVFIENPENKVFIEGGSDFVEAVIDGHPFPNVTWFKGNRECMVGPKYTCDIDPSTGIVGLTIKKIKSDDEAKYTLKISNDAGEEQYSVNIFVKCMIKPVHKHYFMRFSLPKKKL